MITPKVFGFHKYLIHTKVAVPQDGSGGSSKPASPGQCPKLAVVVNNQTCTNDQIEEPQLSNWFNSNKRPDVITITDWHAPVIWQGTYNRQVLEKYYKSLNITIGLATVATGKFINLYLEQFIESADKHFMVGYNVIFYILIDDTRRIPHVELSTFRTYKMLPLRKDESVEDSDFVYMKNLNAHLIDYIQHEVNFFFVMAINQIFKSDFGVETLGESVAQLHAWWYFKNTREYPYERRTKSTAFIPFGQGDFYYHRAIFGGTPHTITTFIRQYLKGFMQDTTKELNSIYESYLNKYFFVNKPTKLLSPEYNWDPSFKTPPQIKHVKIAWQSEMT
ncbi:N-acetyllactosaminide alpha-1,3-galactosyltransferase-like 1 [Sciurus carolinensis]|uniref:N-acetyllactosaminide alpha-1,3-galactosyltransferase-like 1 n=1 Tax=Sciurus carolinensis TaxID=30640 RepID=UPI001FB517D7|nr:N-acetyllactosaminide alpha-1,3-galactosyltransferase-like 1 [Sciurus carolinensis]